MLTCVDSQTPKDIFVLQLPPGGTLPSSLHNCSNINFIKAVKKFYLDNVSINLLYLIVFALYWILFCHCKCIPIVSYLYCN